MKFSMKVAPNVEAGAVFTSGMAAIASALFAYLRPGDALVFLEPLSGGTDRCGGSGGSENAAGKAPRGVLP